MIEDGIYEALVVEAEEQTDEHGRTMALELTILSGPRRGDVVRVVTTDQELDELELLAMPATLTVVDGRPSVRLER
ncbi:MAG: hypothetical protein IPM45_05985 [Acidimicrobiales bacterium]|nr:hypothetical protein [Acidimicrobiales bacterium]